jgi:hypothetical protein
MSETNGPSAQVQYLRALGHDEAADALAAANALVPHEPDAGKGEPAPEPQRQPTAADAEAQRRAEGEAMMAALRQASPTSTTDDRQTQGARPARRA